ncbi:hypothetical protein EGW08_005086, partial [Elysia chlorotica]
MLLRAVVALLAVSFCSVSSQDQYCGVDVVFLLDASGSVGSYNFAKTLTFMDNVVDGLTIGPDDARIGLIRFSTYPYVQFYLNTYSDKQTYLSRVTYSGGASTNTGYALQRLRIESFTSSTGHRSNVPKIAVVITGDKSPDVGQTSAEAQMARNAGIILLTIGVGQSVDDAELKAIASDPDSQNVHRAAAFDALSGLEDAFAATTCAI